MKTLLSSCRPVKASSTLALLVAAAASAAGQNASFPARTAPVVQNSAPGASHAAPGTSQADPSISQQAPVAPQAAPVAQNSAPVASQAAPSISHVPSVAEGAKDSSAPNNYYGANSPSAYESTARGVGPSTTEYGSGATAPAQVAPAVKTNPDVRNLNSDIVPAEGAPLNGTGEPFTAQPVEETGLAEENPLESTSSLIWITFFSVVLIGSIFGAIRFTQPGGQA